MQTIDDPTRNPAQVVRLARTGTVKWQPGDGTQYRVSVSDGRLRVTVAGQMVDLPLAVRWTDETWQEGRHNPSQNGYDWWPLVIRPLLDALDALAEDGDQSAELGPAAARRMCDMHVLVPEPCEWCHDDDHGGAGK